MSLIVGMRDFHLLLNVEYNTSRTKEEETMNDVLEEKAFNVDVKAEKDDEYVPHEEIEEVTHYLLEKHKKAFIALANA